MLKKEELKDLMDLQKREILFNNILIQLKNFSNLQDIHYYKFETSEGTIPIIKIAKSLNPEEIRYVKVFIGAQHNEYNGLFGIIEFLRMIEISTIQIDDLLENDQMLLFAPLMNPYGFLNPRKDNKSGYFLRNGTNLNRYWRKTFAPDYKTGVSDSNLDPIPEHATVLKRILEKYWNKDEISIYILDFHETSLFEKFTINLINNLYKNSITYKFSHWLEEGIIHNIIKLNNIKYTKKPLFYKCNSNASHSHINLTIKQLATVYQKLQEYVSANNKKLPFYFCYSNRSKEFCQLLAQNVYEKLKDILWETSFPAFYHNFNDHGCFVNMNDATERKQIYSMELETLKQFFNIFDEIEKVNADMNYYNKKVKIFDMSTQLVVESILQMLKLF
ncbi:MAG: hypothetical protein ACFFA0_12700 [Promethearchaeota archaeon]